ncbi:MAG TPA: transketolase C-terminal domain-containing protein [Solirubrobacteraceae bacterium]|nr:transketolase C-terminal domain-containing protein [Solirubrobacteraceae bacterium]
MRDDFIAELTELADVDERVVLLTGDLGYLVLDAFASRFPDRFFNVGVAEQNMIGIATGLAEAGYVPFAYSIATFATMRPYEFVRNGPVLHNLPVRIVGVGGGFDYGFNGITHFALEDYALMRAQPDLMVVAPADSAQARAAVLATRGLAGPIYFRIAKRGTPVPGLNGRFAIGGIQIIRDGTDIALIAIGSVAREAQRAAEMLAEEGISATVAVVSTLNPSPTEDLAELLGGVPLAISVETHYVNGGLGSLVAETIAEHGLGCRLIRAGVATVPRGLAGSQRFLEDRFGLSAHRLAATAQAALTAATA